MTDSWLESISRYDLVLAVIPTAFIAALLVDSLVQIPPRMSLLIAASVCPLGLLDVLFVNPPGRLENPN